MGEYCSEMSSQVALSNLTFRCHYSPSENMSVCQKVQGQTKIQPLFMAVINLQPSTSTLSTETEKTSEMFFSV